MSVRAEVNKLYSLLNPNLRLDAGIVIQFISATPQEGTSTIAREFALTASQYTNNPILLLDFDWEEAGQRAYFNHPDSIAEHGRPVAFTDWSIDTTELLHSSIKTETTRLEFSKVGDSPLYLGNVSTHRGSSLFMSNVPKFWNDVRKQAVLTVVDCPAASQSFTGLTLSSSVDAVIIVVAAEQTRAPIVHALHQRLHAQDAPVVGIVMNKRRQYIPHQIYHWLERL